MMEQRWCLDCQRAVSLDVHGRCEICGSNAVAPTSTTPREYWLAHHAMYLAREISNT